MRCRIKGPVASAKGTPAERKSSSYNMVLSLSQVILVSWLVRVEALQVPARLSGT